MLLPRYFVFLSLTPRPPRSTLFPYTTLFRSNTLLRSSSTAVVISPPLGFAPFTRPSSTALLSLGHDSSRGLKKPRGQGAEHHAANMCHVGHPPCLRCSDGTDAHQLQDKPHPE